MQSEGSSQEDDNKSHTESNNSVDVLDNSVSIEGDCCDTDDLNDQLHWAASFDNPAVDLPSEDNDVELDVGDHTVVQVEKPVPTDANKIVFHQPLLSKHLNQIKPE